MSTLVVDSGSTKSIWSLLKDGQQVTIETEGINPYYQSEEAIYAILNDSVKGKIKPGGIEACYFYGAGCTHARYSGKVKRSIKKVFDVNHIRVNGDLLGAARAACQQESGVIAILGTGSISGFYDGEDIVNKVPALGYVLGDEGSGTFLGKLFLKKYLRGDFSLELMQKLKFLGIEEHEVIEKVYTKPFPNRYLAGYVKKINALWEEEELLEIVYEGFRAFFEQHMLHYEESDDLYVIGSVGWRFKEQLQAISEEYNINVKKVLKNPIEGLIQYHG